jgi:hypothetical protein
MSEPCSYTRRCRALKDRKDDRLHAGGTRNDFAMIIIAEPIENMINTAASLIKWELVNETDGIMF